MLGVIAQKLVKCVLWQEIIVFGVGTKTNGSTTSGIQFSNGNIKGKILYIYFKTINYEDVKNEF